MKKIGLSLLAVTAISTFGYAGGDLEPIISPVAEVKQENGTCWYVGIGSIYNRVYSVDSGWFDDNVESQDETLGMVGIVGCDFHENLAIEGRITSAMWEREYSDATTFSIFLKPKYPVNERFTVYGLIGFGYVDVEGVEADNGNPSLSYGGVPPTFGNQYGETIMNEFTFQWGLGLSYKFTQNFSVFFDYTNVANDKEITPQRLYAGETPLRDKLSVDGLTVGITYHF